MILMKTLTHETTGRTVTLSDKDPLLSMYQDAGWKETKSDGARKSRRSAPVPAEDADDSGDGKS